MSGTQQPHKQNHNGRRHMKPLFCILHHKSLTLSLVALSVALFATSLLPDHNYRMQQGNIYFFLALTVVVAGLAFCAITLINLGLDRRSGYPSLRCSLATVILALAWGPIAFLGFVLMGWFY
jgi:hypothetical protein